MLNSEPLQTIVWKRISEVIKTARGHVVKIDDTFVHFDGERGMLYIPKKAVEEIK